RPAVALGLPAHFALRGRTCRLHFEAKWRLISPVRRPAAEFRPKSPILTQRSDSQTPLLARNAPGFRPLSSNDRLERFIRMDDWSSAQSRRESAPDRDLSKSKFWQTERLKSLINREFAGNNRPHWASRLRLRTKSRRKISKME